MAAFFHLHICSAERELYDGDCVSLTLEASDGALGLLANHTPMVAAVVPGKLSYRLPGGTEVSAAAGGGIVRFANNDALVLLDSVEKPEEIDAERAAEAAEHAREAIARSQTPQQRAQARSDLSRAEARLRVARQER